MASETKNILISPAHYLLDINSRSQYYAAAKTIYDLAAVDTSINYYVICGVCNNPEILTDNVKLIEVFKNKKDSLTLTLSVRILFYLKVLLASSKILITKKIDILWMHLPNGIYCFNLSTFFFIDKIFNPKIKRVIGRLTYSEKSYSDDMELIHTDNKGSYTIKKTPFIQSFLSKLIFKILSVFSSYFFGLFDSYIFQNKAAERFYLEKFHSIEPSKSTIIPVGIERDKFAKQAKNKTLSNTIKMMFAGNLTANKRVDQVIEIVRQLKAKRDFELTILGDGVEMAKLKELVEKYDLTDNINLIGSVPKNQVAEYYKTSNILFLLSKSESFGHVMLESWASKTLFIGSDIPVFNDIIKPNHNGFIVDMGKDNYLETVDFLATLDQENYDRITSNAFEESKTYDWSEVVKAHHKLFTNL